MASNDAESIISATQKLLREMVSANGVLAVDIAAVYFTATEDLDAAFPAEGARRLGWQHVPLLDGREIPVPGSLPRCIRVLLLWNTDMPQCRVVHVYHGEARKLRPDLVGPAATRNRQEDGK